MLLLFFETQPMIFVTIVNEYSKPSENSWDTLSKMNLSFSIFNLFVQWIVIFRDVYMITSEMKWNYQVRWKRTYPLKERLKIKRK